MRTSFYTRNILLVLFFILGLKPSFCQPPPSCTWKTLYSDGWENTNVDTAVIAGTCYGLHKPITTVGHTGTSSLYLNFTDTTLAGTMCYNRSFTVCPGSYYKFSCWFTTAFTAPQCSINVKITDSLGNSLLTFNNKLIPFKPTWLNLKDSFIATNSIIHFQIITDKPGSSAGNDLSVDDLLIQVCKNATVHDTVIACGANPAINLFDSLPTYVSAGGTWSGPSTLTGGSLGTYDPNTMLSGSYTYLTGNCMGDTAIVYVNNLTPNANLGPDITYSTCTTPPATTFTSPSPSLTNLWNNGTTGSTLTTSTGGTYWLDVTNAGCTKRDSVLLIYSPCPICPILKASNDTTLCAGTNFQLKSTITNGSAISTAWSPKYGLSDSTSPNPTLNVTVDTSYIVTVKARSANSLIVNGDFSQGNVGFNSGYTYTNTPPALPCGSYGILGCEGYYAITNNANNVHSNFPNTMFDHTNPGPGAMFIANGSSNSNIPVWCQNITILPNTDYEFSAWVSDAGGYPYPNLQFTINGTGVGGFFSPSPITGLWTRFFIIWNSGSNTSINICLRNTTVASGGNDFALDDISFVPVCTISDTVKITTFKKPSFTLGADTTFCDSVNRFFKPLVSGTGTFSYLWSNSTSKDSLRATQAGTYTLQVNNQCANSTFKDTVVLTKLLSPKVNLGNDTLICNTQTDLLSPQVSGSAPLTYSWQDASANPTLTANTVGLYWVKVSNFCGVARDSMNISFMDTPSQFQIGNDTTICVGGSAIFGIAALPSFDTLVWQDGITKTNTFTANNAGTYWLEVRNHCGAKRDTALVDTMNVPKNSSIGPKDTLLCNGASLVLTPTPLQTGVTYLWQDNIATTNQYTAQNKQLYFVKISNKCGFKIDSVNVDTLSKPAAFTIGSNQGLCAGGTLEIHKTPAALITDTLLWQDGITKVDSFKVTSAGTYYLDQKNQCGSTRASVTISILPKPTVSIPNIVPGCDSVSLQLTAVSTNTTSFLWSNSSVDSFTLATSSGTYKVTATNSCGVDSASLDLAFYKTPTPVFKNKAIDSCAGKSVLLDAENVGMSYVWSNGKTSQQITVTDPKLYTVKISDAGHCPILDSVTIINHVCEQCKSLAPTAFTPNNDGKNDVFRPIFECDIEKYIFRVYNRWGELIFESTDYSVGWDGFYKNTEQNMGVYTYYVEYKNIGVNASKFLTGTVTLLR